MFEQLLRLDGDRLLHPEAVDPDDGQFDDTGRYRSNGRSLNAQRGQAEQAEDQHRVQAYVGQQGDHRGVQRHLNHFHALQTARQRTGQGQRQIGQTGDTQIGNGDGGQRGLLPVQHHGDHGVGEQLDDRYDYRREQ